MSGSHRCARWRSWRVLGLTAVLALGLLAAPAYASPSTLSLDLFSEAPPLDPAAMVAQVGPALVNIDTKMGYQSAVGAGTGIVLTPNGQVLTNNHVIEGATSITATDIGNGQTYDVDVIGYDRNQDVALLQLRGAGGLPTANLGDSSSVAVGDPIVAMGNAEGANGTPSAVPGTVVALNQTISAADSLTGSSETLTGMIQANAPIRPGDSGGPMVNSAGQVIGMNTAASGNFKFFSHGGQGFAIPIDRARAIAGQIQSGAASGTVHIGPTAFLGVGVSSQGNNGAKVVRVLPDAPAAQVGITADDVITSIDGQPVNSATELTNILDRHHPGDTVSVGWRGPLTGEHTANVTLAAGPPG
ncbi:MAG: trypsin-like peptidase domain-containing protein [Mycobacterium sp.]|uniref:S1C family serine protease n=1 Tax=Mycobacterium sp. TaxID=1785 RepID=UPI0026360BEA|nr:trypsin-like peptidase domain-containing protein [Mycobacterium sp.]MDI3313067.1 trypsin-like peptidase domain-containing protein [Mycobacterium sp.]